MLVMEGPKIVGHATIEQVFRDVSQAGADPDSEIMIDAELLVDGQPIPFQDTLCLPQSVARPGGTVYRLRFVGLVVPRLFQDMAFDVPLSPADQWEVLFVVERMHSLVPGESTPPAAFFLNTVESIHLNGEVCEIEGSCSEVVTHDGEPKAPPEQTRELR